MDKLYSHYKGMGNFYNKWEIGEEWVDDGYQSIEPFCGSLNRVWIKRTVQVFDWTVKKEKNFPFS